MEKPTDLSDFEYESMLLGRHVHMAARAKHTSGNLERSAYILLSRLRVQGPMSIGELSEAFDLDHSTLNRQTAALLREGLVERIPDPAGGMARKFRVTSEGRRRLGLARAEIVGGLEKLPAGRGRRGVRRVHAPVQRGDRAGQRQALAPAVADACRGRRPGLARGLTRSPAARTRRR